MLITDEKIIKGRKARASITVEASLVLPIFLLFFMSFLYFIQIITMQEVLQEALTETGYSMSRVAYIYSDFQDALDADNFDSSLLEEYAKKGLEEIAGSIINKLVLKGAVKSRVNTKAFNSACIVGGFDGISFDDSQILEGNADIDIVARYSVKIPISIFGLSDMDMIQRVRLRGWNGHIIPAVYAVVEEEGNEDETMVYITESGKVYHTKNTCSHISLSVEAIMGKPTWQRNKNGGKYYPCESCCSKGSETVATYYITSYGDRYHIKKDCSRIKRTVRQVPLSEVGSRAPCKRCGQ
jgi:hypothetical protein